MYGGRYFVYGKIYPFDIEKKLRATTLGPTAVVGIASYRSDQVSPKRYYVVILPVERFQGSIPWHTIIIYRRGKFIMEASIYRRGKLFS